MLPRQLTLPPHPLAKLNPSLSHSCSLLAPFPALPCFRINHLQPLFAKHPGWGIPNTYRTRGKGLRHPSSISTFRMNTCKSVSKQTTLTPFRMNTYAKQGEGGPPKPLFPNEFPVRKIAIEDFMEKRVSAADASRRFSELLRGVRMGRRYLITSDSKAIAKLIPAETDDRCREAARTELLTRLKGQPASKSTKTRWRRDELYES